MALAAMNLAGSGGGVIDISCMYKVFFFKFWRRFNYKSKFSTFLRRSWAASSVGVSWACCTQWCGACDLKVGTIIMVEQCGGRLVDNKC